MQQSATTAPRYMLINPLAFPKGQKFECELCGAPARFQCADCKVTCYCSHEHQNTDWDSIHALVCQQLVPIRQMSKAAGSKAEIDERQRLQTHHQRLVLDIARPQAQKSLFEGRYSESIPAALLSLRISLQLYGPDSIEVVPAYLLLGESFIGMKQYSQAEEYLTLARWSILKARNVHEQDTVTGQLYRNFGLLYENQGKMAKATEAFAQSVYFTALTHGPEHIAVTGGFYKLGSVLEQQGNTEAAAAYFDKVVDVWATFCAAIAQPTLLEKLVPPAAPTRGSVARAGRPQAAAAAAAPASPHSLLGHAQQAEAITILKGIYAFRKANQSSPQKCAECQAVLGRLYVYCGEYREARDLLGEALQFYESYLGRDHGATNELREMYRDVVNRLESSD